MALLLILDALNTFIKFLCILHVLLMAGCVSNISLASSSSNKKSLSLIKIEKILSKQDIDAISLSLLLELSKKELFIEFAALKKDSLDFSFSAMFGNCVSKF